MTVCLHSHDDFLTLAIGKPAEKDDCERYLAALETVSNRELPFFLLVDVENELALSQHHRKAQNRWYKANRERMDRLCLAAAIIRLRPTAEAQRAFRSLWRFPLLVTGDRDEAEAFLSLHRKAGPPL